jgi:hypothetical protein
MSDYRVNVFDRDNHVLKRVALDCADDNAAIEYAKQYIDGHDIEVWQGERRIARFDTEPNGK